MGAISKRVVRHLNGSRTIKQIQKRLIVPKLESVYFKESITINNDTRKQKYVFNDLELPTRCMLYENNNDMCGLQQTTLRHQLFAVLNQHLHLYLYLQHRLLRFIIYFLIRTASFLLTYSNWVHNAKNKLQEISFGLRSIS